MESKHKSMSIWEKCGDGSIDTEDRNIQIYIYVITPRGLDWFHRARPGRLDSNIELGRRPEWRIGNRLQNKIREKLYLTPPFKLLTIEIYKRELFARPSWGNALNLIESKSLDPPGETPCYNRILKIGSISLDPPGETHSTSSRANRSTLQGKRHATIG